MYGDGGFYFLQPVSADATYGGLDHFAPPVRSVNWGGPVSYTFTQTSGGGKTKGKNRARPKIQPPRGSAVKPKQTPPKKFTLQQPKGGQTYVEPAPSQEYTYDPYASYTTPDYLPPSGDAASGGDQPYFTTYDAEKTAASLPTGESSGGVMEWVQENKVATAAIAVAAGLGGWMIYKKWKGR